MPGLPDPLLGSRLANVLVALAVALVLVLGPLRYRRAATPTRLALASGVTASAVGFGLWAVPRFATDAFAQFSYPDPVITAAMYAIGTVVLGLQVAAPLYAYVRYGLVAPLAVAVVATTLSTFLHFQLGGETESFALYVVFSPWILGSILVLGLLEGGARRFVVPRAWPE